MKISLIKLIVVASLYSSQVLSNNINVDIEHLEIANNNFHVVKTISVNSGDVVSLKIKNTCTDVFTTKRVSLRNMAPFISVKANTSPIDKYICKSDESIDISFTHSGNDAGHQIFVNKKADSEVAYVVTAAIYDKIRDTCNSEKELAVCINTEVMKFTMGKDYYPANNASIMLLVAELDWSFEFAGGISISDVVNPKFAIDENNKIFRSYNSEDSNTLGLTGYIHTVKKDQNWVPFTFGMGLASQSDLNIYLGTSWRFDNNVFLTLGYNWTKIDTLPAKFNLGDSTTDSNDLASLGQKTDGGVFIGVSYSFLSPGETFFTKAFTVQSQSSD